MSPAVIDVVDCAYHVFLISGAHINYLPRKFEPEIECALLATPLRAISRELLAHYTEKAYAEGLPNDRCGPIFFRVISS